MLRASAVWVGSLVLLGLGLSGCAEMGIPAFELLDGTEWTLVSMDGKPTIQGANVTAEFRGEQVSGYSGCNWYGGEYSLQLGTITVKEIIETARLCERPAGVMEQGTKFLEAMRGAERYLAAGGLLQIESADGTTLVFDERVPLAMDPADLVNTSWRLTSLNGAALPGDVSLTLELQNGTMRGHAGCRDYRGVYEAENDHISFPSLEMLTTECASQELLVLEGEFTTYLSETRYFRLEGDTLELSTAGGQSLLFARVGAN
jgi:heat shock protein HslJ